MFITLIEQIQPSLKRLKSFYSKINLRVMNSDDIRVGGRSVLVSSAIVVGFLLGIKQINGLERLELLAFDQLTQLCPSIDSESRLLIVAATEKDIQAHNWPLSDQTLAQLLEKLQLNKARAIGLDLYRDIPKPPGTAKLNQQLKAANLVAIYNVGSDSKLGDIPPPPAVRDTQVGFNDLVLDPDAVVRRSLMFVPTPKRQYYSFALRLSLVYLANQNLDFRYDSKSLHIGKTKFVPLEPSSGGYQNLDAQGYQILLRYRPIAKLAPQVTVSQVLKGEVDPALIADKVVLIGAKATSIKDEFYTPYSFGHHNQILTSGVEIHAQIVSQILDAVSGKNSLYWFWSPSVEALWLWGWCVVGGILAWWLRHPFGLVFVVCISLCSILGTGLFLLMQMGWIPVMEPAIGFLATVLIVVVYRLFHTTYRDYLTGLLNRESFLLQIKRSLNHIQGKKKLQTLAVVFVDLDGFKLINKSLGHQMGDRLLLSTAHRLRRNLPHVKIARVGGDEFAILLCQNNQEEVIKIVDRLQESFAVPFYLDGRELTMTMSAGIALTKEGYDFKPEDLLRDAHTAMYRAKAQGKARSEVFAAGMFAEAMNRLQLESDMRRGIQENEFLLHYQPIICFKTGKIAGFEALVRWQHPEQGFVSPAAFIPLAEETGLIIPLGKWIFQTACAQIRQWQEQFPAYSLMMSINLSVRQFAQPDLVEQLEAILQALAIQTSAIKLEITESMVMGNIDAAIDLMLNLKSLGLKLGIDDFGTGYSSLSYLHRFPLDTLKVDRSFVSRMDESSEDNEIVHTIIALGHKLGMDIIAEGIEKESQMHKLKALGCEYGQGFFFSKPLPRDAATTLLQGNNQW